jgi:copper(I)-binding protein
MKLVDTRILISFALLALLPVAQAAGHVKVRDAWIPTAPPVAGVMAGYFEIENSGTKAVVINGVSSPAFASAMMHKTIEENGMSRMIHMEHVSVAPHSKVSFQPGGLHVMLMSPKHPLKVGDKVAITLQTVGKQSIHFNAVVKPAALDEDSKN